MLARTAAPNQVPFSIPEPAGVMKVSFYCFCLFELAYNCRIFDLTVYYLHIPFILSIIALIGAVLGGGIVLSLRDRIGMCILGLTTLYFINVPFSYWRSGSIAVFTGTWIKSVMVFLLAGSLLMTLNQCKIALNSIAWGAAIGAVLVNWKGVEQSGRLVLAQGRFGNPNEIAFAFLLALPCMALTFVDSNAKAPKKVVMAVAMLIVILGLVRTGSRAGLIGFSVLAVLLFLRSSLAVRAAMMFLGVVLALGILLFLPHKLKERYLTLFEGSSVQGIQSSDEAGTVVAAVGSTEQRKDLLMNSIKVTLRKPLLGCGLGQFATYMAAMDLDEGHRHSNWLGTHNTYTQISSEAGIPALLLFLGIIVFSFKSMQKLRRRAGKDPGPRARDVANIAFALQATLVAYSVCICFEHVAYDAGLPTMAGLIVGVFRVGMAELDLVEWSAIPKPAVSVISAHPRIVRTRGELQPRLT